MYAYSRIKKVSTKRSKSLDLTNPHTSTSLANYYNSKPEDNKPNPNITRSNTTTRLDPTRMLEQDHDEVGEIFGVILGRKYPGCSSTLSEEKQRSSFHSVVKRSFSMRRSASVAEGYRRMNRCCCHELSIAADEDDLYISSAKHNSQKNHVKKRGKLFKVCRSLFGLM